VIARALLGLMLLALLAGLLELAGPAAAQSKNSGTTYGTMQTTGPSALPSMGAAAPPTPGFNAFGWNYAKGGGYGSSFSPSGGYGSAAGPSYNTGAGPATQTIPNYSAGFGASSGSLFSPGSPSGTGGSNAGQGTSQNSATAPNAR